jgi:hypothetical protein
MFPMNSVILLAALAFVPATMGGQNAGCDACDCCGCCETGGCECKSCTCACCADECPTTVVKVEREGCCGSDCCGT